MISKKDEKSIVSLISVSLIYINHAVVFMSNSRCMLSSRSEIQIE
jgi:hypothetical protein